MAEATNGHGESRLDRMERLMDLLINDHLQFQDQHRSLLRSQVLLTEQQERTLKLVETLGDSVSTLSGSVSALNNRMDKEFERLAQAQRELYEAQKHTDERLNALIATVDDIIRGQARPRN